jgi:outer membrane protein assembly factor BamB
MDQEGTDQVDVNQVGTDDVGTARSRSRRGSSVWSHRAIALAGCLALGAAAQLISDPPGGGSPADVGNRVVSDAATDSATLASSVDAEPTGTSSTTTTTTEVFVPRADVLVDPQSFGRPYGDTVQGVLTFRGNPTRSYYGTGPLPVTPPRSLWSYPANGPMCGESSEYGDLRTWCGTGWTGQPAVFERDGRTWLVFGAYDWKVHFVDADTGEQILPPFETGDLAKGNVTVDPDGFPLVYVGSRDNYLRVIAFDGDEPRELWRINGRTDDRMHNDDWDAAPLVLNDHLIVGGENSWFHGIKLNRGYAADGAVTADPALVFRVPGWDEQLIDDLGSQDAKRVSLEASVAVSGDTAWLNSSGGLLQGWDISSLRTGTGNVERTFRYWVGDDADATVVPDDEGFLFVGVEVDRANSRGQQVGQLLKIDPARPDDPIVWSIDINNGPDSGTWGTPIVHGDVVFWNAKPGRVYGIDRASGELLWKVKIPGPVISSPVLIDDVLVQGDGEGALHAFDVSNPRAMPPELWTVDIGGNIESTPVVWDGVLYVGTREGYMVAVGV